MKTEKELGERKRKTIQYLLMVNLRHEREYVE